MEHATTTMAECVAPVDWKCSGSDALNLALPHHQWDGHRLQPIFLSTQCFSVVFVKQMPVVVTPIFHYFESFFTSPFRQPKVKLQDTLCDGLPLFSLPHMSAVTASGHLFLCHGLGLRQRCAYGGGNALLTYTLHCVPWVSGALGLHRVSLVSVNFFSQGGWCGPNSSVEHRAPSIGCCGRFGWFESTFSNGMT